MPTVISPVPTAEGFVIGSDGRSCSREGSRISDDTQKIFAVDQAEARLAFGIYGKADFGLAADRVLFSFKDEVPRAIQRITGTWWEFISALTREVVGSLNGIRSQFANELSPKCETCVVIGGFYQGHQKLAHIGFKHLAPATTGEPYHYPDGWSFPFGSLKVIELLHNGDQRFKNYAIPSRIGLQTIQEGIERVRKDILIHYSPEARALDPAICSTIGGRIQIATVTATDGFRWVPGFEAINC